MSMDIVCVCVWVCYSSVACGKRSKYKLYHLIFGLFSAAYPLCRPLTPPPYLPLSMEVALLTLSAMRAICSGNDSWLVVSSILLLICVLLNN